MAGPRPPKRRATAQPAAPSIFATTPSHSHFALQHADHTASVFTLPSATRVPTPAPPPTHGVPHSLALTPAATLSASTAGIVLHNAAPLLELPPGHYHVVLHPPHALVAGGSSRELLLLAPPAPSPLHRHGLLAHHRHSITALAAAPDLAAALVCSQAVTLHDVASGAVLRRFAGHSAPVSAAVSLPRARFATAAASAPFVAVWDAAVTDRPAKRRRDAHVPVSAARTLVAPEHGVVALAADPREASPVAVAAILLSGAVAVWPDFEAKGPDPLPCAFVVRPSAAGVPVFGTAFPLPGRLAVVYGSALKPAVHVVALADISEGASLQLPLLPRDVLVEGATRAERKAALVKGTVAKSASAVPPVPEGGGKDRRKQNGILMMNGDAGTDGEEEDSDSEGESEEDEEEPSIQQKLKALGVSHDNADIPGFGSFPSPSKDRTVLGSRVAVLLQAVRSRDSDLFDKSIERVTGKALIRGTVERLPQDVAAGAFLDMLVERLQKFPTRAEFLVQWIREVLLEHAGALISQRRNQALLALVSIVEERTQALEGLSRLEGRLELVVGQAERMKRGGRRTKTGDAAPLAEYEEEEGSESERDDDDDDDSADSSVEDSEESGSEEEEQEQDGDEDADEGETNANSHEDESDSSEASASDAEMEDDAVRVGAEMNGVGVKMNGSRKMVGLNCESEDSSDDGD